jgi:serine/threonine protein kinase
MKNGGKIYLNQTDFDLAIDLGNNEKIDTHEDAIVGTEKYRSPEIFSGIYHNNDIHNIEKYDPWAIGVIAYHLCFL